MKVTPRCREMLEFLVRPPEDEDGELVRSGGEWWFGLEQTTWRVVKPAIVAGILRLVLEVGPDYEVYGPTPEVERVLADPEYETMLERALRTGEQQMGR